MSKHTEKAQFTAISVNLEALRQRLVIAIEVVDDAESALDASQLNQAIGSICELERSLPECDALLRAILVLHRMRSFNLQEGGAL